MHDYDYIKRHIPILEVARKLGIEVRGNKALCTGGHDKSTWSLTFSPDRNLWYCHGCDEGGSTIDLVMFVLKIGFKEAVTFLAGDYLPQKRINGPLLNHAIGNDLDSSAHQPDHALYEWLLDQCSLEEWAGPYLMQRSISIRTAKDFGLKTIQAPGTLLKKLISQLGEKRALKSGAVVIRLSRNHSEPYRSLIWWDRTILFPFWTRGRVSYIQGRRLSKEGPKFVGLKGLPKPMFNGNVLETMEKGSLVLICEGLPDVLAAHTAGLKAVGVPGAHSFKPEWVVPFLDFRVVLIPDSDPAGASFAEKVRQAFLLHGKSLEIARIDGAKDLAAFFTQRRRIGKC